MKYLQKINKSFQFAFRINVTKVLENDWSESDLYRIYILLFFGNFFGEIICRAQGEIRFLDLIARCGRQPRTLRLCFP